MVGAEVDARAVAGPLEVRAAYTGLATENEAECTAVTGGCAQRGAWAGATAGRRQPPLIATARPATPTKTIGRAASEFDPCIS